MAQINVKRFVDIDIKYHIDSTLIGTRDTVVLFTPDGTNGTIRDITSISDVNTYYSANANTKAYLDMFFNNSGVKVRVIEGTAYSSITAEMIANLDNKYILIAAVIPSADVSAGYAALKTIATTRSADSTVYGVNEKIILARTTSEDDSSIKNFAVKKSSILGAEMTMAAYLTRIDVYRQNSVYDYMFTPEAITEEELSDSEYATVINNNENVDVYLAGAVRNCGGNCKDGSDLTNEFVRIVLHQTLTDRLITLLTQKVKGSTGISKIYNTISQELDNYLNAGYLATDKIWTDDTLITTYNGRQYTVIEKGTALLNGYQITVLPFSALSDADKAARKAPPIYVVIADQYTIRQITINGEVI